MKFNIILATTCLALGATIAWVVKPDSTAAGAQAEAETDKAAKTEDASPTPDDRREISDRTVVASDRDPKPGVSFMGEREVGEMDQKMQSRMTEMFEKRRMAKLDARIAKLVSQLNLTPEQEAALRKAAEEKMAGLGDLFSGNTDPSKIGDLMKGDGIDEALADILTPEQKEEHEAVKKRELANRVEARALKNLAKLSNLDLTQEQKDAAYDIFYQQAEGSITENSSSNGMLSMITDSIGIEIDGDALGFTASIIPEISNQTDSENGEAVTPDPQDMIARMRENQAQRIDDQVEALRPVLNDSQLEQYRSDLELKSGGILGGFLGGFSGEGE